MNREKKFQQTPSYTPHGSLGLVVPYYNQDNYVQKSRSSLFIPKDEPGFKTYGNSQLLLSKDTRFFNPRDLEANVLRDHPDLQLDHHDNEPRFLYKESHSLAEMLEAKQKRGLQVTITIPAKNDSEGVRKTLQELAVLQEIGLIDNFLVVDADTDNGKTKRAALSNPHLHVQYMSEKEFLAEYAQKVKEDIHGQVVDEKVGGGKGTALAAATTLYASEKDVLLFCDADINIKDYQLITALDPLLSNERTKVVFPFFDRYTQGGGDGVPRKGARVTELIGKMFPQISLDVLALFDDIGLGDILEPLGGLYGGIGAELAKFQFPAKYGVEVALLIESLAKQHTENLEGYLVQLFAGTRVQQGQTTENLAIMGAQIYMECLRQAFKRNRLTESFATEILEKLKTLHIRQSGIESNQGRRSLGVREFHYPLIVFQPPAEIRHHFGWQEDDLISA